MATAAAAALAAACSYGAAPPGASDVGVTARTIVIGGTAPLSGPHHADGTIVKAADAYLQYVNAQGGVHGRKISFSYLDDGGDPQRTLTLTHHLVEQDTVFLTFAGVGTDEQRAVRDYLRGAGVPQAFVASGSPELPGWQPTYRAEGAAYGAYLLSRVRAPKIAVILDHSTVGQETFDGLQAGLGGKAGLIGDKQFNEGDAPVTVAQLAKFKSAGMDTLFVLQSPRATILTLVAAARIGWRPRVFLPMASQSPAYLKEAQRDAGNDRQAVNGVTSATFLRSPDDASMGLYRQVMTRYYPGADLADPRNVYGMGLAYSLVDVLRRVGDNPTRRAVKDALAHLSETDNPCLLPGITLNGTVGSMQIVTYDATAGAYKRVGGLVSPTPKP